MNGETWPTHLRKGDKVPGACKPLSNAWTSEEIVTSIGGSRRHQRTHWKGACRAKFDGGV
jgi:hypothetical protein